MDRWVAVRFFRVSRASESHPTFADVLETIGNINDMDLREKKLAPGVDVRLEVFDKEGQDVIMGEMTRLQSTNMPSHIRGSERLALTDIDRLGHSIVFRYDRRTSILCFQYARHVLPPFRFFQYLQAHNPNAQYHLESVIREDMWERFESKNARTLEIAIADPASLDAVACSGNAVISSMKTMAEAYAVPRITVSLSMGYEKGHLGDAAKALVSSLLGWRESGAADIRKLKARASDDAGEGEYINLLAEVLERKEELRLHNTDPDVNYQIKQQYLKRCMNHVS